MLCLKYILLLSLIYSRVTSLSYCLYICYIANGELLTAIVFISVTVLFGGKFEEINTGRLYNFLTFWKCWSSREFSR